MRTLIRTSEHKAMTRLASSLPKGSEEPHIAYFENLPTVPFKNAQTSSTTWA